MCVVTSGRTSRARRRILMTSRRAKNGSVNGKFIQRRGCAGADPEIEEGGGIHIKWGLVQRA